MYKVTKTGLLQNISLIFKIPLFLQLVLTSVLYFLHACYLIQSEIDNGPLYSKGLLIVLFIQIDIPRQILNQLVMNYLVTEGFKVQLF